jgi:WD40 repeat protein
MRLLNMRTCHQHRKDVLCMVTLLSMAALAFTAAAFGTTSERSCDQDQPSKAQTALFERVGSIEEGDGYSFPIFSRDSGAFLAQKYNVEIRRWDTVRLWDAHTLKPLTDSILHDDIRHCGVTANGKMVFTADKKEIRIWDVATSTVRASIKVTDTLLASVAFNADGTRFATIPRDDEHTVSVWRTGDAVPTLLLRHERQPGSAVFDTTGTRIVTDDGAFHIFATDSGREIGPPIPTDTDSLRDIRARFDSSGRRLLVPQGRGFTLVDLTTGKTVTDVKLDDRVSDVQFSVDGTQISATTEDLLGAYGPARIYDTTTGKFEREIGSDVAECEVGPGARWILCFPIRKKGAQSPELWDLASGVKVQTFPETDVHLSPDGALILFKSERGLSEVWRLNSRR